ncbi:hypothetical protein D3C81_1866080 [compost metagenome]
MVQNQILGGTVKIIQIFFRINIVFMLVHQLPDLRIPVQLEVEALHCLHLLVHQLPQLLQQRVVGQMDFIG